MALAEVSQAERRRADLREQTEEWRAVLRHPPAELILDYSAAEAVLVQLLAMPPRRTVEILFAAVRAEGLVAAKAMRFTVPAAQAANHAINPSRRTEKMPALPVLAIQVVAGLVATAVQRSRHPVGQVAYRAAAVVEAVQRLTALRQVPAAQARAEKSG
jgi:hypothetical protein